MPSFLSKFFSFFTNKFRAAELHSYLAGFPQPNPATFYQYPPPELHYGPLSSSFSPKCKHLIGADKLQSRNTSMLPIQETLLSRRSVVFSSGALLVAISPLRYGIILLPVKAEENDLKGQDEDGEKGVLGSITSLFDPDEKTKSGKVLPKAYLKSAREVVKTLRDSLKEDTKDNAKFRRTADAAKESIREYLNDWRGQKKVSAEESYIALEKAIRSLASFFSKAGPSARLPEEVKSNILDDLNTAEAYL